jgi:hypothetical protein
MEAYDFLHEWVKPIKDAIMNFLAGKIKKTT